jgi:hypothetical protein
MQCCPRDAIYSEVDNEELILSWLGWWTRHFISKLINCRNGSFFRLDVKKAEIHGMSHREVGVVFMCVGRKSIFSNYFRGRSDFLIAFEKLELFVIFTFETKRYVIVMITVSFHCQ